MSDQPALDSGTKRLAGGNPCSRDTFGASGIGVSSEKIDQSIIFARRARDLQMGKVHCILPSSPRFQRVGMKRRKMRLKIRPKQV
jgi:hypothetical protein